MNEHVTAPEKRRDILRRALLGLGLVLVATTALDFSINLTGRLGGLIISDTDRLSDAVDRMFAFRVMPMTIGILLIVGAIFWLRLPRFVIRAGSLLQALRYRHILGLVLSFYISVTIIKLVTAPLGFDEGYNLTVSRNLALHGFYGSTVRGVPVPFDPFVSTGPAVLAPIGSLFRLLGDTVVLARLVMLAYHLMFIVILILLTNKWIGRTAIPIALLVMISIPGHFFQTTAILGEVPAVMWYLAGLLIADHLATDSSTGRHRQIAIVIAGLMWGLAALSKPTFLVMIASSAAIAVYLKIRNKLARYELGMWLSMTCIAGVVTGGWFVTSAALRGPSIYARDVIGASGAAFPLIDPHILQNSLRNLSILTSQFEIAVLIGAILFFWVSNQKQPASARLIMLGAAACWILWWVLFNGRGWTRYVYPALLLLTIPIAHFADQLIHTLRTNKKQRIMTLGNQAQSIEWASLLAIGVSLCIIVAVQSAKNVTSVGQAYALSQQQDQMVQFLNEREPDVVLTGLGWLLAWDIAFHLPERDVLDLLQLDHATAKNAMLIVTPNGPDIQDIPNEFKLEPFVDFGQYKLYRIQPSTE